MSDAESHSEVRIGSERNFGLTFAAFFLVVAFWPFVFRGGGIRLVPLGIAVLFLIAAFFLQGVLAPLNRLWFKFGLGLAKITGPIVMGIVFVVAIIPTGLLKQKFGKDAMRLKRDPAAPSYWIERSGEDANVRSMKRQF